MTNKQIEDAAIEVVLAFERDHGRHATDVRSTKSAFDVQSTGRKIEVKGMGREYGPPGLWRVVQKRTATWLKGDDRSYVYVVDNLLRGKRAARIYVLDRAEALLHLKSKPRVVFGLSVPKSDRERLRQTWRYAASHANRRRPPR